MIEQTSKLDLYKWAYKLLPLIPSELVADCFALAREIRILDVTGGAPRAGGPG